MDGREKHSAVELLERLQKFLQKKREGSEYSAHLADILPGKNLQLVKNKLISSPKLESSKLWSGLMMLDSNIYNLPEPQGYRCITACRSCKSFRDLARPMVLIARLALRCNGSHGGYTWPERQLQKHPAVRGLVF